MTPKRLWHTFRIATQRNGYARAAYMRKHNLFYHIGERVYYQGRKLPLYAELISIGNNVKIASRVNFITHSIIHLMLNGAKVYNLSNRIEEQVGCIEIGDNVFIGAGTTILNNVQIGSNVIIGAGSVITKDVPSNSVVAGVPARVIETIDEYIEKISKIKHYPENLAPRRQEVSHELANYLWNEFIAEREKTR